MTVRAWLIRTVTPGLRSPRVEYEVEPPPDPGEYQRREITETDRRTIKWGPELIELRTAAAFPCEAGCRVEIGRVV